MPREGTSERVIETAFREKGIKKAVKRDVEGWPSPEHMEIKRIKIERETTSL